MPAMTVTPSRPRPKIEAISGVIATSGTERSTIAIGMNVCSADGARLKHAARRTPRPTAPANEPDAASVSVSTDAVPQLVAGVGADLRRW